MTGRAERWNRFLTPLIFPCSAFGATAEEALRELEIAKAAWLEAARAEGKPIPEPKYRPLIYQAG